MEWWERLGKEWIFFENKSWFLYVHLGHSFLKYGLVYINLFLAAGRVPPLSKIYRVPASIQDLQSSYLYPGFTEFLSLFKVYRVLSLSRVYRAPAVSIQGLQSSYFYSRFTESYLYPGVEELLSLSRVSRVPISIQGLQSSHLYSGFTELLSLSRVSRVTISIQDLQSSCLYPGFREFPSLSRVYRVPVSIQGLQSSRLYIFLVSGKREGGKA